VRLRLRDRTVELREGAPLVMGIVNASPESFSDGAAVGAVDAQVRRALALREAGADIVDVGGESGVTDRPPVAADEEARRVVPVIERVAAEGVTVSVDTWKAEVARAAVEAGAAMINDVSGLSDPAVADVCAGSGSALVVMHTRVPPKQKAFPPYDDVVADVVEFLRERVELARGRGVEDEQIVVDPGPDFAKTPAQTVEVLRRLRELRALGRPVLLAASRKEFIGALRGRPPAERLAGTLAAIAEGVDAGAAIIRVHDVADVRDFLQVRAALRGERDVPTELRLDPALRREAVRDRVP
jgi:dihydropteroate synthase